MIIRVKRPPRSRRRPSTSKTEALRAAGTCPHSKEPCQHARLCILSKPGACSLLLNCIYRCCRTCRKDNAGKCLFACFRFQT